VQVQVDEETGQGPSGAAVDLHHQLRSLPEYARHRLGGILAQHVTACEQPVAAVLFGGASNSQAARALGKTVGAVRGLRKSLFKRLGVHDRGELVLDLACKLWRDLVTRVGPFLSDVPTDQASPEARTVKSDAQLTEDQWRAVEPLVARPLRLGRPPRERRAMLEAMLWFFRNEAPWRDIPDRFGPWRTVYGWYRRWRDDKTLDRIAGALQPLLAEADQIDWERWGIDAPSPANGPRTPRKEPLLQALRDLRIGPARLFKQRRHQQVLFPNKPPR